MVVAPAHDRRQRHEDRLGAAVGLEAEDRPAIVDEVELDVPAAAPQLELALGLAPRLAAPSFDDGEIGRKERIARVAHERERLLDVVAPQVVEEDPADAARLAPVRQVAILVAPPLEPRAVRRVLAGPERPPPPREK